MAQEATWRLLNEAGVYLHHRADFKGAKACFERALAIFEERLGADHPTTRIVRRNLESVGGG